ncbi:HAD family phosphatase [Microlunatus elymi]|uniref:HAD family phosphatase n=2 Tax=Microlunatus elymi TaxID=2596828 RepID=A0A516Q509_9ACTN|nr:HAD family phosphatase [Microlunatus elymi]
MDGTLFDSERLWDVSLDELAIMLGGTLSGRTRRQVVGGDLLDTVRIIHRDLGVEADEDHSARWLLERTRQLFAGGVRWRPGARAVVEAVKAAGIPRALVTSSRRVLVDAVLAQLEPGLFEVVVCGDEVTRPKPDPEGYLTAASRLGVEAANCVVLEDSPRGIAAARAAGCVVVAVPESGQTCPTADCTDADRTGDHQMIITSIETITVDQLAAWVRSRT